MNLIYLFRSAPVVRELRVPCGSLRSASSFGHTVLNPGCVRKKSPHRLGVSRAALYRYEKGEVIKLDTVKRLAELLKISPLSLLGIGVEYYNRPVGYFERVRQTEETADQILQVFGPLCYLTTSEAYDGDAGRGVSMRRSSQHEGDKDSAARLHRAGSGHSWPPASACMLCAARASSPSCPAPASSGCSMPVALPVASACPITMRRRCRQVAEAEIEHIRIDDGS